jgi:hypothetical protein
MSAINSSASPDATARWDVFWRSKPAAPERRIADTSKMAMMAIDTMTSTNVKAPARPAGWFEPIMATPPAG